MKRKLSKEEVRQFFQTCAAQFDEAGFVIHAVRFTRDENDNLSDIHLNFTETDTITHKNEQNPK